MPDIVEWPRAWWNFPNVSFPLVPRSQRSLSPWTMRQNVYGPHVQYWAPKYTFKPMTNTEAAAREALLESLGGTAGLLRIGHPRRALPQFNMDVQRTSQAFSDGTYFDDGTGWISGPLPPTIYVYEAASSRALSVVVAGLPISTSRVLRRGDLVEFRRNGTADETPSLHRVTRDAPTDSDGKTRIEIVPPLRKGLAAGDMAVLDYPMSVFRLADDGQGVVDYTGIVGTGGMSLIEALI